MGKDNFEQILREKVSEAESTIVRNSDKEHVWHAINRTTRSSKKAYYAVVAALLICTLISMFYQKGENVNLQVVKKEGATKNRAKSDKVQQPALLGQVAKQPVKPNAETRSNKSIRGGADLVNKASIQPLIYDTLNIEQIPAIDVPILAEKKTGAMAKVDLTAFSVQFKRGKRLGEKEQRDTKEAVVQLKNLRLSKDTMVYANALEKPRSIFKFKF